MLAGRLKGELRKRERSPPPPALASLAKSVLGAAARNKRPKAHLAFGSRCDPPRPAVKGGKAVKLDAPPVAVPMPEEKQDEPKQHLQQLGAPDLLRTLGAAFSSLATAPPAAAAAAAPAAALPALPATSLGPHPDELLVQQLLKEFGTALHALEPPQPLPAPDADGDAAAGQEVIGAVILRHGLGATEVEQLGGLLGAVLDRMDAIEEASSASDPESGPGLDDEAEGQVTVQASMPAAAGEAMEEQPKGMVAVLTTVGPQTAHQMEAVPIRDLKVDSLSRQMGILLLDSETALQQLRRELTAAQQVDAVAEHVTTSALQALLSTAATVKPAGMPSWPSAAPRPSAWEPSVPVLPPLALAGLAEQLFTCAAHEIVHGSPCQGSAAACDFGRAEQPSRALNAQCALGQASMSGEASAEASDPWHAEVAAALLGPDCPDKPVAEAEVLGHDTGGRGEQVARQQAACWAAGCSVTQQLPYACIVSVPAPTYHVCRNQRLWLPLCLPLQRLLPALRTRVASLWVQWKQPGQRQQRRLQQSGCRQPRPSQRPSPSSRQQQQQQHLRRTARIIKGGWLHPQHRA